MFHLPEKKNTKNDNYEIIFSFINYELRIFSENLHNIFVLEKALFPSFTGLGKKTPPKQNTDIFKTYYKEKLKNSHTSIHAMLPNFLAH